MENSRRHVCVFCGTAPGIIANYLTIAQKVGALLADQGITLVYGGGPAGMMGALAGSCIKAGGRVIAVVPAFLAAKESATEGVAETIVTADLYERKRWMAERSDAFLVLPGGIGTLDEFFEVVSWSALGLHSKPVILLNIDGFWNGLLSLLNHVIETGFFLEQSKPLWYEVKDIDDIRDAIINLS